MPTDSQKILTMQEIRVDESTSGVRVSIGSWYLSTNLARNNSERSVRRRTAMHSQFPPFLVICCWAHNPNYWRAELRGAWSTPVRRWLAVSTTVKTCMTNMHCRASNGDRSMSRRIIGPGIGVARILSGGALFPPKKVDDLLFSRRPSK